MKRIAAAAALAIAGGCSGDKVDTVGCYPGIPSSSQFLNDPEFASLTYHNGQQFEIRGEEPSANGTVLVKSLVKSPGHEDVELTYRLYQVGSRWRIMDVFLKGTVSEVALRRSDYGSVLERDGFGKLVDVVRARIADLAAGRARRDQP